jgi:hypothetical protein
MKYFWSSSLPKGREAIVLEQVTPEPNQESVRGLEEALPTVSVSGKRAVMDGYLLMLE